MPPANENLKEEILLREENYIVVYGADMQYNGPDGP